MPDTETSAAAQAAAPEPAALAPPAAERLAAMVERWFVECIHNSPVARDTDIFNHVRQAVDELKRRLTQEI